MSSRPAAPADLPAIGELEASGFAVEDRWSAATWAGELEADHRILLVAEDAGAVRGVLAVQFVADVAELTRIVVDPRSRARGVGRRLLADGLAAAEAAGCAEMLLEVRHDNHPALALYRRQGFAEIARREGYYRGGVDAVVMRRELGAGCPAGAPEGADAPEGNRSAETEENHD